MDNNKLVCVTGGTGFLASWLITRLLQRGYTVNTTIRTNPGTEQIKDTTHLTNLPFASQNLKIFTADLNDPNSFIAPIKGCIGVFHLAHPMEWGANEEQVLNSLSAILRISLDSKTVKKFIYTSSATTVVFNPNTVEGSKPFDEESWTDLEFLNGLGLDGPSYVVAKTLAERLALDFGEKNRALEVLTVVPSWIVGPFLGSKCPNSVRTSLALIFGEEGSYKYLMSAGFVHVDDVARAHVFLFEESNAKGRYICSAIDVTIDGIHRFIATKYPEYNLPGPESWEEIKGVRISGLSTRKLLEAGFKYEYGLEEMLDGAIQSCKEKGFI